MFGVLVKKQFAEIFKSYFVNQKTGKARSKAGTVGIAVAFGALMLYLCGMFFGLSSFLCSGMVTAGLDWLYFALAGILSVAFSTFGCVFNTYAGMYLARDNDLLISMPIPPRMILLSRIVSVFGLAFLYSAVVWVPSLVAYWIFGACSVVSVVFGILLTLVIAVFVTVLTCILGWLVAVVSKRMKNKNFVTVIVSVAFFGLYFYACSHMEDLFDALTNNSAAIGDAVKLWGRLFYRLGSAAAGDALSMLIFTGVTAVCAGMCFCVLSRTFLRLTTVNRGEKRIKYRAAASKQTDVGRALARREWHRFSASPTYMLNCGMGAVMLPAVAVIFILRRAVMMQAFAEIPENMQFIVSWLPLGLVAVASFILSTGYITVPSVSLEGKHLWILKSLPVAPKDILEAKVGLQMKVYAIPTAVSVLAVGIAFGFDAVSVILGAAIAVLEEWFMALFGMMVGLARPNFTWTNEITVIKQSINIFFVMLAGWLISAVMVAAYIPFGLFLHLDLRIYFAVLAVLFCVADVCLKKWIDTRGQVLFENL